MANDKTQAISLFADSFTVQNRAASWRSRMRQRIPVVSSWPVFAEAGALCTHGPRLADSYRRLAYYADRVLRGTKPADLPIEQPTTIETIVNLKTADALGLTLPQSVLVRADRVIRCTGATSANAATPAASASSGADDRRAVESADEARRRRVADEDVAEQRGREQAGDSRGRVVDSRRRADCAASTAPITAAVNGATLSGQAAGDDDERRQHIASRSARAPASTRRKSAKPAATINGPTVSSSARPTRSARRPAAREPSPIATDSGSSAAPAPVADQPALSMSR